MIEKGCRKKQAKCIKFKFIFFPHSILILLVLPFIFLLTGCFRHCYRAHPYTLCQTDLNKNVREALSTDAVSTEDFCYEAWWQFFQDSQLNQFIELSLSCHPDMNITDARIRLACQEAGIARSSLFPHLFFLGNASREKSSEIVPGFFPGAPKIFTELTLELAATYELDIWQKNRSLYYAALDRVQATIADYEEAKLLLSTTIAAFYFDLQMKLARLEVNRERLKARSELYELLKQRFDLGVISEFRVYEVNTDIQLIKDVIYQLEGEVAIDQHALAALVGNIECVSAGYGELEVKPSAIFNQPFPLPATLPIDLLARRPDITARKWLVEAACYDIKAARADFFPRIDLIGLLGFQTLNISKIFKGQTLVALGEVTATLPLFLAGKLQAQLGAAQEVLEIAIESYNQTVLNAVQEVSDALSDLVTSEHRIISVQTAIQDASALLDLSEQRYKNAIYNKLAVLNAMENLYIQEDLEVQIQLAKFESAVKLIRAIGGGYYERSRF